MGVVFFPSRVTGFSAMSRKQIITFIDGRHLRENSSQRAASFGPACRFTLTMTCFVSAIIPQEVRESVREWIGLIPIALAPSQLNLVRSSLLKQKLTFENSVCDCSTELACVGVGGRNRKGNLRVVRAHLDNHKLTGNTLRDLQYCLEPVTRKHNLDFVTYNIASLRNIVHVCVCARNSRMLLSLNEARPSQNGRHKKRQRKTYSG